MDLSIGAYGNIELSGVYNKDTVNEPLYFGVSKDPDSFSKYVRPDIPEINDTLSKRLYPSMAIETGARNLTDFLDIKAIGVKQSINDMSLMLQVGVNYEWRSLFDVAKLYEEESVRVMGLTDITEKERELRIYVLDNAFVEVARFLHSQTNGADIGRNFDTLSDFVQNAIQNIQTSGLSEKTQSLMIQAMDRTVTFYKDKILFEALSKTVNQRMKQKGWGLSREEIKALSYEQYKVYREQLGKIRAMFDSSFSQLKRSQAVASGENTNDESVPNISDEENIGEETSLEVSILENSSEETTSEASNSESPSE
jgi:hypothetical protein